MAQTTIAGYELGRFPKPETLDKIAAAVGKKVEWIIKDSNEEKEKAAEEQKQVNRPRLGERRQAERRNTRQVTGDQVDVN